jgi:pimeloyl-ACP methyl ester carboxylesterase
MNEDQVTPNTSRADDNNPWAAWMDASVPRPFPRAATQDAWSYWRDACQRAVLFLDVMRQRSDNYLANTAKTTPNVLKFDCTLVADGRKLPRPVNYGLVRITPPADAEIDPKKRPFVVIDPRAGHGPGIGGFKADSEIGVAIKAGHTCYFIGFLPEPMPGQTIEDIMNAEATFLEQVIERHPEADGKPAVIGNCQAGWAVMMLAAARPELFGPILIAGSPLSYWAGVRGKNPMRYSGGLLGGSWLTALFGDLGNGKFDGAWLVANFENLNPANTLWTKQYNLYSKVDSEAPRYLRFEEYWGGHVLLNAEEMQFIVDQLFVGNKLAAAEIVTSAGSRLDLRNIRSPILVFCSKGDNITPPQQALGWILDLYNSVDDIRAHGQTIVYSVHESIGHLGIFVSGSVAKKEHDEFASNIDLIDVLPPGLYEAVLTPKDPNDPTADLIAGDYLVRFETRDLDAIRALGGNGIEDERKFATVARISEINLGLYRTFLQPWVRAFANEASADWMRRLHPLRLPYELLSDSNPFMRALLPLAERVRADREPVARENLLLEAQGEFSKQIVKALESYGQLRDHACEELFHTVYGSPVLQAMVGLKASDASPRRHPGTDAEHVAAVAGQIADFKARIGEGGPGEAAIRALMYIRLADGDVDERGLALLRRIRDERGGGLTLAEFKQLVRDQFFMLLLDEERALGAIPSMIAKDREGAAQFARDLQQMIAVVGPKTRAAKARLAEIEPIVAAVGGASALDVERLGKAVSVGLKTGTSPHSRNAKKTVA